jgi:hypothetical protein
MNVHEKIGRIQLHRAHEHAALPKISHIFVQFVSFSRIDLLGVDKIGGHWNASVNPNWRRGKQVTR